MYTKVLVATDGSETASKAVQVAVDLASKFGAELHVADIFQTGSGTKLTAPDAGSHGEGHDRGSVAETQADSASAYARSRGVDAESHVVRGDPAQQIVALATKHGVGLIVVGNKGMRGAKRALGSVPNTVAHKAPCSVLIVDTTV